MHKGVEAHVWACKEMWGGVTQLGMLACKYSFIKYLLTVSIHIHLNKKCMYGKQKLAHSAKHILCFTHTEHIQGLQWQEDE